MHTRGRLRRVAVALITSAVFAGATFFVVESAAHAAGPATIVLGSDVNYSVLGASTVSNVGFSVLEGNVGLSPGTAITGFPPGVVTPPGVVGPANDAAAQQAQVDLTAAYDDAANRSVDTVESTSEIGAQTLPAGVYAAPANGALQLTGALVLDGNNDPNSVFIFQAANTLTTASDSSVTLINGAQECNVFWQVGSSATLGTRTQFAGNILAAVSISADTNVVIHGRALAATGAVTLDTALQSQPTCDLTAPSTTLPATTATTSTIPTTTTLPAATTTVAAATTTVPSVTSTVAPTTVAPTTVAPTTVAPTTVAPTTVAPTTVAPTTSTSSASTTTTPAASTSTGAATTTDPAASSTTAGATTTTGAVGVTTPTTASVPTSNRSGIGVAGPPQTGAAPRPTSRVPWSSLLIIATLLGAVALGGVAGSKRRRARG